MFGRAFRDRGRLVRRHRDRARRPARRGRLRRRRSRRRAAPDESIDNLRDLASGAPVVRAVNDLMEKAMELRASDIHIEPFRDGLDGAHARRRLLAAVPAPAARAAAGADFAHQNPRRPQHRRAAAAAGRRRAAARRRAPKSTSASPPCRPSTAKSAVIRLLPRDRGLLDIAKLGLAPARREQAAAAARTCRTA